MGQLFDANILKNGSIKHANQHTTGNIRVLQEMLGHKNILTTQRYVHPDISHLRVLTSNLPESI